MRERTNEETLDLFAFLLEPVAELLADQNLVDLLKNSTPIKAVQFAVREHKKAVIEILARLDGAEPDEYKVNLIQIPIKLLKLLNDPQVQELFSSQDQQTAAASSGPATENTEERDGQTSS